MINQRTLRMLLFPTILLFATSFMMVGDKGLKIGKKAPMMNIKMDGVDGNQYALQDLIKSNGLMVVFSCNTCPFVVGNDHFEGWERQYNEIYEKAQDANIGFVLINSNEAKRAGEDSLEEMKKHAEKMNYKMHYLVDKQSKLADAFGAKTTPHVFVINGKGKLVYKGSIDNSWDSKRTEDLHYVNEVITALTREQDIPNKETQPRGCSIKRN